MVVKSQRDISQAAGAIAESFSELIESALHDVSTQCESPIESQLLAALLLGSLERPLERVCVVGPEIGLCLTGSLYRMEVHTFCAWDAFEVWIGGPDEDEIPTRLEIRIQPTIGRYRADFTLYRLGLGCDALLVVECDGHDFHEKTKEQAKRDKSRDREMKIMGHDVFRFTGSEIFNDADGCAKQSLAFLEEKFNQKLLRTTNQQPSI